MSERFSRYLTKGQHAALGLTGTQLIKSADGEVTGSWVMLIPLADTVFTTLTDSLRIGAIAGVTFPTGVAIPGNITVVEIASGGPVLAIEQPS